MLKELDPLLPVSYTHLTLPTSGNLSVQIDKLSAAEYIRVRKEFVGKKTRTSCQITEKGRGAFEAYVNTLKEYLNW